MKILILEPEKFQSNFIYNYFRSNKENEIYAGILEKKILNFPYLLVNKYEGYTFFDETNFITDAFDSFDVVFPTGYNSFNLLSKNIDMIKIYDFTYDLTSFDKICDKLYMLELCKKLNIPVPDTYAFNELYNKSINYPLFYKESHEVGGGRRGIIHDFNSIKKNVNYYKNNIIFQEYMSFPGTYGFGFTSKKGKVIDYVIHNEIISYPKHGGSAVIIKRHFNDKLIKYSKKIIEYFKFSGWGLIEYKYNPINDDYYFMEFNAKLWASFAFSHYNNPALLDKISGISTGEKTDKGFFFLYRMFLLPIKYQKYTFDYYLNNKNNFIMYRDNDLLALLSIVIS